MVVQLADKLFMASWTILLDSPPLLGAVFMTSCLSVAAGVAQGGVNSLMALLWERLVLLWGRMVRVAVRRCRNGFVLLHVQL